MTPTPEPGAGSPTIAAVAAGAVTALAGAAALVVLANLLDLSAGLLVVAFFLGRFTALAVASPARARSDANLSSAHESARESADDSGGHFSRGRLAATSIGLALLGVLLGQVGLWFVARAQGGVLDLAAFLAETYGALVPGQLALAAIGAWWPFRP